MYNQPMMVEYELSVSARGLSCKDTLSNSDPFCVLYIKDGAKWTENSRSETINDDSNPSWMKRFNLTYTPQMNQEIKFEVFDYDPATGNDFMGRVETTLGTIIGAGPQGYRVPLVGGGFTGKSRTGGELTVRADLAPPPGSTSQQVSLQFAGENIESKDFIGKSDPYLVILRSQPDGSFAMVHRTEFCKNTKSPAWKPFTIDTYHLCHNDWNRIIKFECYDWDDDSNHDFIGECTTTLKRLSEGPSHGHLYELVNRAKLGKKNYNNSGYLKLLSCNVTGMASYKSGQTTTANVPPAYSNYPQSAPQQRYAQQQQPPPQHHQPPPPATQAAYPPQNYPPATIAGAGYPPQQVYANYPNPPVTYSQQQPGYPPQPAYPQSGYPQAAPPGHNVYPPQQPQVNPGYPSQMGFNPTSANLPFNQPGYPPQPGGPPPTAAPGYPPQYPQQSYPGYPPAPGAGGYPRY